MKAEELMIGCLLRVNREGLCIKNGTIIKVLGVDGESKLEERGLIGYAGCQPLDKEQFCGGIWLDYLAPIPITPEILKNNGFRRFNEDGKHCERYVLAINTEQVPQTVVDFSFYDNSISADTLCKIWTKPVDCYGQNDVHICNLRYVHELQRAFRLLGIEREIRL